MEQFEEGSPNVTCCFDLALPDRQSKCAAFVHGVFHMQNRFYGRSNLLVWCIYYSHQSMGLRETPCTHPISLVSHKICNSCVIFGPCYNCYQVAHKGQQELLVACTPISSHLDS